jgi:hypothetical protein
LQTVPADSSTSAPANGTVGVVFSEAMDQATLTTTTLAVLDANKVPVPVKIYYDPRFFIAQLVPAQPLAPQAQYTVAIDPTVAATNGMTLGQTVSATFTTTQAPARGPIQFAGIASAVPAGATGALVTWQAALSPDYAAGELFYAIHAGPSAQAIDFSNPIFVAPFGATQAQVSGLAPGATTYLAVRVWDMAGNTDANTNAVAVTTPSGGTGGGVVIGLGGGRPGLTTGGAIGGSTSGSSSTGGSSTTGGGSSTTGGGSSTTGGGSATGGGATGGGSMGGGGSGGGTSSPPSGQQTLRAVAWNVDEVLPLFQPSSSTSPYDTWIFIASPQPIPNGAAAITVYANPTSGPGAGTWAAQSAQLGTPTQIDPGGRGFWVQFGGLPQGSQIVASASVGGQTVISNTITVGAPIAASSANTPAGGFQAQSPANAVDWSGWASQQTPQVSSTLADQVQFSFTPAGHAASYEVVCLAIAVDYGFGNYGNVPGISHMGFMTNVELPASARSYTMGGGGASAVFVDPGTAGVPEVTNSSWGQTAAASGYVDACYYAWSAVAIDQNGWACGTTCDVPDYDAGFNGTGMPATSVVATWPWFDTN